MDTQRVAYIVSQYPTVHHTFILREIRQLRDLGVDVDVYSISDPDRDLSKVSEVEAEEQQQTRYVKRVGLRGAIPAHFATFVRHPIRYMKELARNSLAHGWNLGEGLWALLYFAEAVIVGRWIVQSGVKRLHCHFSSNVALPAARLFSLDLSLTIHGPAEHDDPETFRTAEKVAFSSQIIATSHFSRSQIMRSASAEHWPKIKVVYLGIDPQEFVPRTPPNNETTEIICVGRLAGVKAQQILLTAFGRLVDSGYDILLRLVGDGDDRARLESYVQKLGVAERVVFEGWLNQDQVQDRLRHSDIFALASFAEGMPVVLMEAMAMEIPCVTTTVNGIPELIRDRIDGLIVPPSDPVELAEAMARLIDDERLRKQIGQSARQRVLDVANLPKNGRTLSHELFGAELLPMETVLSDAA